MEVNVQARDAAGVCELRVTGPSVPPGMSAAEGSLTRFGPSDQSHQALASVLKAAAARAAPILLSVQRGSVEAVEETRSRSAGLVGGVGPEPRSSTEAPQPQREPFSGLASLLHPVVERGGSQAPIGPHGRQVAQSSPDQKGRRDEANRWWEPWSQSTLNFERRCGHQRRSRPSQQRPWPSLRLRSRFTVEQVQCRTNGH